METTRKETFRQLFIKISKHVTKKQYNCYSSEINEGFYNILFNEIENNFVVKSELYEICKDTMQGKYKFKNLNHLSLEHFYSDEYYFDSRLRFNLRYTFSRYGISKKNTYFICTNLLNYFKNVFLK